MKVEQIWRGLAAALALLGAACAQGLPPMPALQASETSNELPPLDNGVYIAEGFCIGSEYECTGDPWRATAPAEVHERLDPASRVIATLAPGDRVWPIGGQYRMAPRRGVVRTAIQIGQRQFEVGDVLYQLEPQGEGSYGIWYRGANYSSYWEDSDTGPIAWDAEPLPLPAGAITGEWVQFRLEGGRTGWVANGRFECAIVGGCGPADRQ